MNRYLLLTIVFLISTVASAQQTTVDKNTASVKQLNKEVSMRAVAIPASEAAHVVIDYANYHKEVHVGVEPSIPVVEMSAAATRMDEHIQSGVAKVATGEESDKKEIYKTDQAQRIQPK